MFEGVKGEKLLSCNLTALNDGSYMRAGQLMVISVVLGGPPPHFLAPLAFDAVMYGPENARVSLEDVSDEDIRSQIKELMYPDSEAHLQESVSQALGILSVAGCSRAITMINCKQVAEELAKWFVLHRTRAAYESFAEGLASLGILDLLRRHPSQMRPLFLKKNHNLTAEVIDDLFTNTLSERGSNNYTKECRTVGFWRDFLQDCEFSMTPVSLEEILAFATGTNCVPALGLSPMPSIKFCEDCPEAALPLASTCANVLWLPTFHKTFEAFVEKMSFGIKNSPGFGFA